MMDADAVADAVVWLIVFHISYSSLHSLQIQLKVLPVHFADIDTNRYPSGNAVSVLAHTFFDVFKSKLRIYTFHIHPHVLKKLALR